MVSKEIIQKTFDTTIKSHQHLRLNSKCLPLFDAFHDKHCGVKPRKSEISVWADKNGDGVFTKKGNKNRVSFTDREIRDNYEKYGELNVTHNHPRDNLRPPAECLSDGDLNFLTMQISQYGKRDDGSEGFLGYVYPFKSISCESSNGSRMTVVRGDKFSDKDNKQFKEATRKLQKYHQDYYTGFYDTMAKVRKDTNMNDFPTYEDYQNYLTKTTFEKMGRFEDNREFKDIQGLFRGANCKLTMTQPREFQVGLWQ